MPTVTIDQLAVGSTLATDVRDRTGRTLLRAGAQVTSKHLVVFRTWGVPEVSIVGEDGAVAPAPVSAPDATAERMSAAASALAPIFRTANLDHPAVAELFRLACFRKATHGARS